MKKVVCVWKEIGLTPFQLVESLKTQEEFKDKKIGFAGRLDPMAEGIMLLLVGEENKKRKDYERLPKTYEFEILTGISTDTYDVMGMPYLYDKKAIPKTKLKIKTGKFIQAYPPYSYARVRGKPLYFWARADKLKEIEIPQKEVQIYNSEYLGEYQISFEDLLKEIKLRLGKVKGDFRQQEIISSWEEIYKANFDKKFNVYKFKIECSSGTYVRSLAYEFGRRFGTGGVAYKITRTKVGNYVI